MKKRRKDKDAWLDAASERAGDILMFYKKFKTKKPIMLLELPSQKIYAYPYLGFKETLSERSQRMLEKEYEEALRKKRIVVYVKDNLRRQMISFSVDEE